jgi:hypothetical protein
MSAYSDDSAWDHDVVDAELAKVFADCGILTDGMKRRVLRHARRRLVERATRDASRVLAQQALGAGWTPPAPPPERFVDTQPLPVSESVQDRALRWARARGDFSARDLQRGCSHLFEKSADTHACLNGLVARGELETLPVRRRSGRGRLPSPVTGPCATSKRSRPLSRPETRQRIGRPRSV